MSTTTPRQSPTFVARAGVPSVRGLRLRTRGLVLRPGEPGFDAACAPWNLSARHRPDLAVVAAHSSDVVAAVRFAARHGLPVGVMATGHGTGTPCEGGVLVNTARLRRVRVLPDRRTVRVQSGARWQDVIAAATPRGLAGLSGSSSHVGVVGYTSGGGFGWLGRHYGFASDAVVRATVVTASGSVLRVDAARHPDLFWAIRGGGANVGLITSLDLRLPRLTTVHAGTLYYPLARAEDVLTAYAAWTRSVPDALATAVAFLAFPPAPQVPEPLRGKRFVAVRACYSGPDLRRGPALVGALRGVLGAPDLDTVADRPVADLDAVSLDPTEPVPALIHCEMVRDLTPATIRTLTGLGAAAGSPLLSLELRQLGGALSPSPDRLHPMGRSGARFSCNAIGLSSTPEEGQALRSWFAHLAAALAPHVTGATYVNFLELDGASPERVRAAYSAADWDRLVRVKQRYDPHATFRFTRFVPPGGLPR